LTLKKIIIFLFIIFFCLSLSFFLTSFFGQAFFFKKTSLHGVLHYHANKNKHENIRKEKKKPRDAFITGFAKHVKKPSEKENIEELKYKDTSGVVHVAREFSKTIIRSIA